MCPEARVSAVRGGDARDRGGGVLGDGDGPSEEGVVVEGEELYAAVDGFRGDFGIAEASCIATCQRIATSAGIAAGTYRE